MAGQQTALTVSYDGDYRHGGNIVVVASPPVSHLTMPASTACQHRAGEMQLHHVRNAGAY